MEGGRGRVDLPPNDQARALAEWLQGPRSRALRRAGIGLRERVLELGAGHCVVTPELQRRARGRVVAIDIAPEPFTSSIPDPAGGACADAVRLPFVAGSLDLVFAQNTLLWVRHLAAAVGEAVRVLAPGGALVAVEPDYGGMMEYPELGLREVWVSALSRSGAEPLVGRRLPELCERAGLEVWVELAHIPQTAEAEAVGLLEGLDLTDDERRQVATARQRIASAPEAWSPFLHVPYFLVVAEKR